MSPDPTGPDAMTPDEVAKRAMELAARAEELARHAHETAGIDEQLAQLEAELDALDAEEAALRGDDRKGNADADADADDDRAGRRAPSTDWADVLTERVGSLGDRIGLLVEQVTDAAMHRVEAKLGGDLGDDVEEHSIAVERAGEVRISNHGGSVRVQAHADNTVAVTARGRKLGSTDQLVDVELHDGVVSITSRNPRRLRRGVRLDVTVPFSTGLVISTGGGSVRVDDVRGVADLRTGGGSIHLSGARGRADLTTGGGSIDVVELDGTLNARAGGGSINVDGRLTGSSSLRTGGGNITVRVGEGTNIRVDGRGTGSFTDIDTLHTQRGRISGQVGDGTAGLLEVKTGGGTIRIVR